MPLQTRTVSQVDKEIKFFQFNWNPQLALDEVQEALVQLREEGHEFWLDIRLNERNELEGTLRSRNGGGHALKDTDYIVLESEKGRHTLKSMTKQEFHSEYSAQSETLKTNKA